MQEDFFEFKVDDKIIDRLEEGKKRLFDNDDIFSERFFNNIKAVEKFFPNIYEVIKDYIPENKNVFMEEDGALNIYFSETGYTLFSEYPFEQVNKRYESFCENPGRTVVNLEPGISDRCRHEYYLTRVNALRKDAVTSLPPNDAFPDLVGGLVLFGFDLGYQLVKMLDEKNIKHIYIYEENIDLFYYSLFSIDWEWVCHVMQEKDCTIHLFLGVDEKKFIDQYLSTIRYNGMYMAAHTYLYMGYGYEHVKKVIDEFKLQFARQVMGWGFFDDGVRGIGQYIGRKKKVFLATHPKENIKKAFNKKLSMPVFILGNGPSLDKSIDFVKENRDSIIIVSCGSTINTLSKYNIKPDYHADVERLKYTAEKIDYIDRKFLSGITALTVNVMHPDFYDHFEKNLVVMKPGEPVSSMMSYGTLVSEKNRKNLITLNHSGPIVANLATAYMVEMGFSDIYLSGVDCGFKDPNIHHAKNSPYYFDDGSNTGLAVYKNLLEREANFGGKAYTTELMDASRIQLELTINYGKKKNPMFSVFNLSEGVRLAGAIPTEVDDCLIPSYPEGFKDSVKDYIWQTYASEEPLNTNDLGIDSAAKQYEEFVGECYSILNVKLSDKESVLHALAKFNSLVMQQNFNKKPYNCELMYGSFIYFANEVVGLLFASTEFDKKSLEKMLDLFKAFLDEMPGMVYDPTSEIDLGNNALEGRYNA